MRCVIKVATIGELVRLVHATAHLRLDTGLHDGVRIDTVVLLGNHVGKPTIDALAAGVSRQAVILLDVSLGLLVVVDQMLLVPVLVNEHATVRGLPFQQDIDAVDVDKEPTVPVLLPIQHVVDDAKLGKGSTNRLRLLAQRGIPEQHAVDQFIRNIDGVDRAGDVRAGFDFLDVRAHHPLGDLVVDGPSAHPLASFIGRLEKSRANKLDVAGFWINYCLLRAGAAINQLAVFVADSGREPSVAFFVDAVRQIVAKRPVDVWQRARKRNRIVLAQFIQRTKCSLAFGNVALVGIQGIILLGHPLEPSLVILLRFSSLGLCLEALHLLAGWLDNYPLFALLFQGKAALYFCQLRTVALHVGQKIGPHLVVGLAAIETFQNGQDTFGFRPHAFGDDTTIWQTPSGVAVTDCSDRSILCIDKHPCKYSNRRIA